MTDAPPLSAASATDARTVSTEMAALPPPTASTAERSAASTRDRSTSSGTPTSRYGAVDAPPMSMSSAPSSTALLTRVSTSSAVSATDPL